MWDISPGHILPVLGRIRRSQPKDDGEVRDSVSVAVLDHLNDIQHVSAQRVQ